MLVTRLSPVLLIHWSRLCKICKRLCLAGCINMYVCVTSCWVFVLRASWHQLVQLKHSCWREKFNMWLFWCHLPFHWFLFFMSESGGFSPHGAALSTTASASLTHSLSLWRWRHAWRFTSCLTKKCSCSRLAAPGILARDLCGGVWTLSGRIPLQGGARVAPYGGRLFSCHISSRLHPRPLGLIRLSFCEGHGINNPQVLYG